MTRAWREPLPGGGVVLTVSDSLPGPPPLRFERLPDRRTGHQRGRRTDRRTGSRTDRRWVLRQGEELLIQARSEGDGCCRELHVRRLPGHRSPLPPLSAALLRSGADWPHSYARWLEDTRHGPLHRGRWRLTPRTGFAPGIWGCDLVEDWPDATLDLLCGGGWHGVLPLRPLPAADSARVKAYRKHAREGTLAPVLLWWVSFLDGWLLLDGHARAAAALLEHMQPPSVELVRVPDDTAWRATAAQVTEAYEERIARLPRGPHAAPRRQALDRGYADVLSTLPYDAVGTPMFDERGAAHPSGGF